MRQTIPSPLISLVADILSRNETHASMESRFHYADAPGEPPEGSKHVKALEWLRRVNKTEECDPLSVLGKLIEDVMERGADLSFLPNDQLREDRERLSSTLATYQLKYMNGGHVVHALGEPSRSLEQMIRGRDGAALDAEFARAASSVLASPRDAVSAASNILESLFKIYIEDEALEIPQKQDLKSLWSTVRRHLGFDPGSLEDTDLKTILSGLFSVVEGIGALRTHASSAHGAGRRVYRLEPRHARLAVHAAHTVAVFILESWARKQTSRET
jgi:hypothetical protein